jgi:hypothetical protein
MGGGGVAPLFFTSALDGDEWTVSRLDRFTPGERVPCTHWIDGWLSPITDLDDMEKRKILSLPGIEPRAIMNVNSEYFENILSSPDINIPNSDPIYNVNKIFFTEAFKLWKVSLSKILIIQLIAKILQNETEI